MDFRLLFLFRTFLFLLRTSVDQLGATSSSSPHTLDAELQQQEQARQIAINENIVETTYTTMVALVSTSEASVSV